MSNISQFLRKLQAYGDSIFLAASASQFLNLSIDDCESLMAMILQKIFKLINKAKKTQPETIPYITLMMAFTRFDEVLYILNEMGKLEKILGFKIPKSNNNDNDSLERKIMRGMRGGAKCNERCKNNSNCKNAKCPSCKDSICQPSSSVNDNNVIATVNPTNNNNNQLTARDNRNQVVLPFIQDLLFECGGRKASTVNHAVSQYYASSTQTSALTAVQNAADMYSQTQVAMFNRIDEHLKTAIRKREESHQALLEYTAKADEVVRNDFNKAYAAYKLMLEVRQIRENAAALLGGIAGGAWAFRFSSNAIQLLSNLKGGLLNGVAWTGLTLVKTLNKYLGFSIFNTINTECVGFNPLAPMYPTEVSDGNTTRFKNEYTGLNGITQTYYTDTNWTLLPDWNKVTRTPVVMPRYRTICTDYELFDLESFTGVPLYVIIGSLLALLVSAFLYYAVRVVSLQTRLLTTKKKKKNATTIGTAFDTVGDAAEKIAIFTPAVILLIMGTSEYRTELETMVGETRVSQNGSLVTLEEKLEIQGAKMRQSSTYLALEGELSGAVANEERLQEIAHKATQEGMANMKCMANNSIDAVVQITGTACTLFGTLGGAGISGIRSIANGDNDVAGPFALLSGGACREKDDNDVCRENYYDDDDEEDDEDMKDLKKKLAYLEKQKREKKGEKKEEKKGGKNKTKKNKNSKKTKKHLLKNNKHKSKRTKQ